MNYVNIVLGIWLVVMGVVTPSIVRSQLRKHPEKRLRGLTYKQLVWCCVAMALCGVAVVAFALFAK
jgi:uncharacterized membrane protein YidH (DUF202 family)